MSKVVGSSIGSYKYCEPAFGVIEPVIMPIKQTAKTCLFFLTFYFYFILLYNTVLVLPYIDMNPPRVYVRSQTRTPLPPPSPQHPSGSSPCTSPKHAVSCLPSLRGYFAVPGGSGGKDFACIAGDLGSIPGLGRSPGGGRGCLFQYSGLENSMNRRAQCTVHRVTKSWT